ncbi:MAG: ACP S-malonyltransferase [Gemmatimonadetes bacterium]|nr:ACP S-malonyltransferase [Gemmatimonadota bacterium]NNM06793.1 ACP S-malonyltransferase [Gemmatimonadota bacterium]
MSVALLFPGQGSQAVGMGRELSLAFSAARELFEEADDILGFSLSRLAWEGPEEELTLTKNAQPALLVHSIAAHRVAEGELGPVTMAAGHSLGEFSAHVAAGTLTFKEALEAVRVRGELMFASGTERPGTMAAVLGLDEEGVEAICAAVGREGKVCVPANFNSQGQVVISGDLDGVARGMELAKNAGAKRAVSLTVSGAFHSPLMEPAAEGLREKLDKIKFSDPEYPVISNVTAEPVRMGSSARDLLVDQLTSPVRWRASVEKMVEMGAARFVELGSGTVLSGLNRRNARGVPCLSLGTPADFDALEK